MSGPDLPLAAAWVRGGTLVPNPRWRTLCGDSARAAWWRWQPGMLPAAPARLDALVAAQSRSPTAWACGEHGPVIEVTLEPATPEGALALARDVSTAATALHRTTLDLLRERQRRAADEFHLERVLHDLCNNFHAIELRVSFLRSQPRASADEANLLQEIDACGAGARRRIESVQREALRAPTAGGTALPGEVVSRAAALARRDGGAVSVAAAVARLPPVVGTADELAIALLHLFDNAREAGGAVQVDGRAEADHVLVTVADDGPGIPAALLPKVCKPFFTTREAHRGHGLAHAAQLVRHARGQLEPGNQPDGGGARITLRLARADRA